MFARVVRNQHQAGKTDEWLALIREAYEISVVA
jgi:hypothetical protein